eukprot:TRINITY_DN41968_c0_g1_i1.p1 TRINITY_DN41968_c0_g1~~TRINITY_DN41968_c0_g1_i1.p1  ORF type:complete len:308 (-),score=16.11 TRINITY_DN41968_c0_g1_i1:34-906(-)
MSPCETKSPRKTRSRHQILQSLLHLAFVVEFRVVHGNATAETATETQNQSRLSTSTTTTTHICDTLAKVDCTCSKPPYADPLWSECPYAVYGNPPNQDYDKGCAAFPCRYCRYRDDFESYNPDSPLDWDKTEMRSVQCVSNYVHRRRVNPTGSLQEAVAQTIRETPFLRSRKETTDARCLATRRRRCHVDYGGMLCPAAYCLYNCGARYAKTPENMTVFSNRVPMPVGSTAGTVSSCRSKPPSFVLHSDNRGFAFSANFSFTGQLSFAHKVPKLFGSLITCLTWLAAQAP